MPRKTTSLSTTEIKRLKPTDKVYSVYDGNGLQLRVKTTGVKSWVYNYYRPQSQKRNNLTLGNFPAISLDDARSLVGEYKELLRKGVDPVAYVEREFTNTLTAETDTFKSNAEAYFKIKRQSLKPNTIKKWERYLEKDVYPIIGNIPIKHLKSEHGKQVRDLILDRGSYDIASKVCNYLTQIMDYADIEPNPFSNLARKIVKPKSTPQKSIKPTELSEFLKAVKYSNMDVQTHLLIHFMLHTLVRAKEAVTAEWDHIDFDNRIWHIPAENMKGKKGTERPHRVPLTPKVIEILKVLYSLNGKHTYVFTSKYGYSKHVSFETANKAIKRTSFADKLTAHGFRAIGKTAIEEIGAFDHQLAEAALAHVVGNSTVQSYTRTDYFDRRKPMMEWWSDFILEAETSSNSSKTSNVKPIRKTISL